MTIINTKEVSVIARPDKLIITDGKVDIEVKKVEKFINGLKNYSYRMQNEIMTIINTKEVSVIARPDRLYITDGKQIIETKEVEKFINGLKNYL